MPVYFAKVNNTVKIGHSHDPKKRMSILLNAHSVHVELIRVIPGNRKTEKWLHNYYREKRITREWFNFCDSMLSIKPPEFEHDLPIRWHSADSDFLKARDAEIVSRYREGQSLRGISEAMNISHEWVRKILQKRNVKLRPVGVH